jgi:protein-S-isoprenylcysteine O-methyltransferase Ste14
LSGDGHRASNKAGRDTADVIAPPPVLYGAALLLALLLHTAIGPWPIASPARDPLMAAGAALVLIGLALSAAVMRAFAKARTPVPPYRPTTSFVSTGLYRYTRNPDYLGQTLLYIGITFIVRSWWPLVLLPLVLLLVHVGVIRREERYLEARFGQTYRDYTARVRRWF